RPAARRPCVWPARPMPATTSARPARWRAARACWAGLPWPPMPPVSGWPGWKRARRANPCGWPGSTTTWPGSTGACGSPGLPAAAAAPAFHACACAPARPGWPGPMSLPASLRCAAPGCARPDPTGWYGIGLCIKVGRRRRRAAGAGSGSRGGGGNAVSGVPPRKPWAPGPRHHFRTRKEFSMPRFHRLAGALALSLGFAGAAHAQTFTGFYAFGDSLSDTGNIGDMNGLPPGFSFTTNPDPVMVEIVADAFGLSAVNSLQGGSNFAWGGACVNPVGPCLNPVPNIPTQITQYLTATGGSADPNALYSIWGGANDIFATLALDPGNAQANTVAAATSYVQQIGRLQAAGANYVIVYNLPNLGVTPQFAGTPNSSAISQVTVVYNTALNTGLGQLGDGIIPVDTFGLITEVMADPGTYGLTNVTGMACAPPSSVSCGPAGAGLPAGYAPGTNETWLFADGVHPTGAAHAMLANVILSTIVAPVQVSMAGEAGVKINENHVRAFTDELMSDFYLDREVGSMRGWATVQYGDQDFDASAAVPGASADVLTLSLGANWRASDNAYWGVAITVGNHDNDVGPGTIEGRGVLASLHGTVRFGGGGYLQGAVTGGSTDLDIDRRFGLGEALRVESG